MPSLVPGHQASSSLSLFFCHSTISVCMLPQLIGLVPPTGQSSIYPIWKLCNIHMLGRGLSHGSLVTANGGEDKVNQEPRPSSKHQIVWTIPSNCRLGGIKGMCYFSQMRWPVSFFVFPQLPDHAHNHLVQSLYQPIHLGVVGHGLQSFDAKDLAQFLNYTTGKGSTPITLEPGWGSKDRDVTSK